MQDADRRLGVSAQDDKAPACYTMPEPTAAKPKRTAKSSSDARSRATAASAQAAASAPIAASFPHAARPSPPAHALFLALALALMLALAETCCLLQTPTALAAETEISATEDLTDAEASDAADGTASSESSDGSGTSDSAVETSENAASASADSDPSSSASEVVSATSEESLQKIETPTVTKLVWDGESYAEAADAAAGEATWYQVTGTLPSNLDDFESYAYEFHDSLDEALLVDVSTLRVEIVREGEMVEEVTWLFETTLEKSEEGWELVLATDDLFQAATELETSDTVVLTYAAELDADTASAGQEAMNYVYLRYTSKAFSDAFGRSIEDSASLYTWSLAIRKIDAETGSALSEAGFTVQAEDGRYVTADGSLSEEETVLEVDEEGCLVVPTLDAGSYLISEAEAPDGYEAAESFDLVVSADLSGASPTLSASTNDAGIELSVDAETGTVSLVVADDPQETWSFELPETGDALKQAAPVAAGLLVVSGCGIACAVLARRRDKKS